MAVLICATRQSDIPWSRSRTVLMGRRYLNKCLENRLPQKPCWDRFGTMLGSFGDNFGIIYKSFWTILGSFRNHVGIILKPFGIILGSIWDHFEIILGSFWNHFGIILGRLKYHFGIILGPFWNHVGIIFCPMFDLCAPTGLFSYSY